MDLNLPKELKAFRTKILSSNQPYIEIFPEKVPDMEWWDSKVGGFPYLPKSADFPVDKDGIHLLFLAQINFEQVPDLEGFPKKGLLQFYICDDEDLGMDFDNLQNQNRFRVVYFPEIDKTFDNLVTDFSFLRNYDGYPPISHRNAYPLAFRKMEELVPVTDYRFEELFGEDFFQQFDDREWDVKDEYTRQISAGGHKLGGYAYFTQWDPRTTEEPMVLLFQLDSDSNINCAWGDMGVGNFFIAKEDLEKLDFSKVLYNWDCY
ncbi:MAG: YwqG family protein [Saprospiraceae bacterium]